VGPNARHPIADLSSPPWRPPPPERSTEEATQRPLERRTVASIRVMPLRRAPKPAMRSKRVPRVTLMRTVPRSESCRRNVRLSRLTDTTVPSNCAADAAAGAASATAATVVSSATSLMDRSS
jgi:hypothetical protein